MYYSQFGEDKILFDVFQKKSSGVCVEVGANNGVNDSNTFFFEKIGWKCILVEPNPILCEQIRKFRDALIFECAVSNLSGIKTLHVVGSDASENGMSTISTNKEDHDRFKTLGLTSYTLQVQTMTLNEILTSASINNNIDFISIDVEGHEYEVLQGFSLERWKPVIMLVEDNSNFENNHISNYLKKFGYVRFHRTGVNDWYAHRTNKQLVNIRSKMIIKWTILKGRLRNIKGRLKNKLKAVLLRSPDIKL
jgi:FkbM family methyltransferase